MKILQVLPDLSAGGAEGFVTNLGVCLTKMGAEVLFFLMAGVRGKRGQVLYSRLCDAGIDVVGAMEHNVHSPMNIMRLVYLIRTWRPDIIQANLYPAEVLVVLARALTVGSRVSYLRRLANTEQSGYRFTPVVRMMDRFYQQTIACSPSVAKSYRDFMGMQHKSELITIPNGGFLQESLTTKEEKRLAREKLNISGHAFVVAHIGRMLGGRKNLNGGLKTDPKAHDVLIRAFAKAFGQDTDTVLVLVGDGPLRPDVEALAKKIGVAEQTIFLGQQPEPWVAMQAADVFCFPSRHEGLPNVLPEAASCGLPVVASNIPEIRSICPDDTWLLKPVDDVEAIAVGLRTVRENIEMFEYRAREAADGFRKRFSMKVCARRYLMAYESALKRSTP